MIKCYGLCHKNNPPASADSIKLGIRALQSFLFKKNQGEENYGKFVLKLCDLSVVWVYTNTNIQAKVYTIHLGQMLVLMEDSSKEIV